jgi:hypothetical protein
MRRISSLLKENRYLNELGLSKFNLMEALISILLAYAIDERLKEP